MAAQAWCSLPYFQYSETGWILKILVVKQLQIASGSSDSFSLFIAQRIVSSMSTPATKAHWHDLFHREIHVPILGKLRVRSGK